MSIVVVTPRSPGYVGSSGNPRARIMVVGEHPGEEDIRKGAPFSGGSGQELDRMLAEAGINREDCFFTNVCRYQPPRNEAKRWLYTKTDAKRMGIELYRGRYPDRRILEGIEELDREIAEVRPNVIVALGNLPLWVLGDKSGVTKWRGSILYDQRRQVKFIPIISPASVLREWKWRSATVNDLRRVAAESASPEYAFPDYTFCVRPTYMDAAGCMARLIGYANRGSLPLAVDIETRGGQIACIGIAWTHRDAICIPIMSGVKRTDDGSFSYWSYEEECRLVSLLRKLLHHHNVEIAGQNFLYDIQYLLLQWGITMDRVKHDTMVAHHTCFPDMPKGLHYLSSLYCSFHEYWKDEGKNFDIEHHNEEQLWTYNCRDAVATFEVMGVLETIIPQRVEANGIVYKPDLSAQYREQMEIVYACLKVMNEGVLIDKKKQLEVQMELMNYAGHYEAYFQRVVTPHIHDQGKRTSWFTSSQQCAELFYDTCGVREVRNRKTKQRTTENEALRIIGQREPIVRPITDALMQYRSLTTIANAVSAASDVDGRMRCSYNPAATVTFRLSSSENAFGRGTNQQNVTTGEKYAEEDWLFFPVKVAFPNLRKHFIPEPGTIFVDVDLEKADANVVAAEANDKEMLQAFAEGADVHTENAKAIFGPTRGVLSQYRQLAKQGVHATNYGIAASSLARVLNVTVHEADLFQKAWFAAHPGIATWHKRVDASLMATRSVTNRFGYYVHFEDRMDKLFTAALAWIPQSTVALVINKLWLRILQDLPWVTVKMQVHDSLLLQIPRAFYPMRHKIHELSQTIVIPYEQPLTLNLGLKVSDVSWGDVGKPKGEKWTGQYV